MKNYQRSGFTLVELLVVIGIISMLIALLLPAVLSGQEQARQAKCQKQMQDIDTAILQYAMRKDRFPGFADTLTVGDGSGGTQTLDVGWVPQIFAYLDMEERLRKLREGELYNGLPAYLEYVEFLTCPSDPPDFETPFWSTDDCGSSVPTPAPTIQYPLSYAVNAGRPDEATNPPDDRRYSLFHDRRTGVTPVNVTMDDIKDGKRNTIVLTENVDMVNWSSVSEAHQGVVWQTNPVLRFNEGMIPPYDCDNDGLADNLGYDNARPSSFHQEGFNVAYASGTVDFFFVDQASLAGGYDIYRTKMTPANGD